MFTEEDSLINPLSLAYKPPSFIYTLYSTSIKTGLLSKNLKALKSMYGTNSLPNPPEESLFSKIKEQLSDVLVIILLIAAIISFITNLYASNASEDIPPWVEPLVIFLILIVNAIIGIYQDYNAENALKALNDLNISQANVLRDSIWEVLPSKDLYPGDIVKVTTGNKVPADIRLLEMPSKQLLVNQAILTGETGPVRKTIEPAKEENTLHVSEMKNLLFSGTLVVQGNGIGVVIATGQKTQIGVIQKEVISAKEEGNETPLRKKLNEFGDKLAKVIGILCLIIWLINISNFFDPAYGSAFEGGLHYFKIAVSLAVAAIPEGLPAVITTCLALGTRRMAKRNAVVRNLTSVETLGCTTVICTDKTGTLTSNEMCVKRFGLFTKETGCSLKDYEVEGFDYSLEGVIYGFNEREMKNLRYFCECLTLCNESRLVYKDSNSTGSSYKRVSVVRLPLEGALRVLIEKIGKYVIGDQSNNYKGSSLDAFELDQFASIFRKDKEIIQTYEFTSEKKTMSVLCIEDNHMKAYIKGAPDLILNECNGYIDENGLISAFDERSRAEVLDRVKTYSSQGLRCIGVAYKDKIDQEGNNKDIDREIIEKEMVFLGVVGMEDPPRPEVKIAVELCKKAGIRLIVKHLLCYMFCFNEMYIYSCGNILFVYRWSLEISKRLRKALVCSWVY